ncbi:hypothetical protein, partial [Rhizobium tibeticum]|uniref:hypothetical protein n=1 Tax=Rhizobium tibeticum TaxID=501024 RepID=UPI0009310EFE
RLTNTMAFVPSVAEIRYLIKRLLLQPPIRVRLILAWSLWRRRHQASAMLSHYKARHQTQL